MWEGCTSWFWLFWSYTPPTPPAPSRINGEYAGSQLAKTFKMRTVRAGNAVSAAMGISVLLHLGGAHKCNVTQRDQQTTYNIPGLSYARGTSDSSCTFTWSNASQTVFATHVNKMEPVTMSRFGELVSSKCIGNMIFSGTCVTEGTPKDYTASCTVTCLPEAEETTGDKGMPPSQIGVIVAAFIGLLLIGLVCFLCYKNPLWSKCRGQTGGFYPHVMFKKAPHAEADVETGGG